VIIERMVTRENGRMVHIPDGMAHHWLAIGFIPGVTRDQAIAVAQNYARHAKLYAPEVQRAEILSREGQRFEVYYRFYRHALVSGPEPECAAWLRPRIAKTPARFYR
jgi:hypothetical protein